MFTATRSTPPAGYTPGEPLSPVGPAQAAAWAALRLHQLPQDKLLVRVWSTGRRVLNSEGKEGMISMAP